ncbi:MAG: 6-carboxytetrahydropterin synthase [Bdellovibrionaceae bacterium]|nr:6-carboxytetrahydropterin synthase [Pseudobdellovibrionaceae bacterium]
MKNQNHKIPPSSPNPPIPSVELKLDFFLESARFLKFLPSTHPCAQLHGHSFKVILAFRGSIQPQIGWLEDYVVLEKKLRPILKQLDHQVLNEIPGLENPTTELICVWLYDKIKRKIKSLHQVTIRETHNTECSYPI